MELNFASDSAFDSQKDFADRATKYLKELTTTLINKNEMYGNSVGNPIRVFSNSDALEQIRVRIDDKLSRIMRGKNLTDQEDTISDLIGYLVILKLEIDKQKMHKFLDSPAYPESLTYPQTSTIIYTVKEHGTTN